MPQPPVPDLILDSADVFAVASAITSTMLSALYLLAHYLPPHPKAAGAAKSVHAHTPVAVAAAAPAAPAAIARAETPRPASPRPGTPGGRAHKGMDRKALLAKIKQAELELAKLVAAEPASAAGGADAVVAGASREAAAAAALHGPAGANVSIIWERLRRCVAQNELHAFYDDAKLVPVVERLSKVDFAALGRKWHLPGPMVYDLCQLALYDVVFFIDDSGSMVAEENGERIDDLKFILTKSAEVMTLFDDDGIQVEFMNAKDLRGVGIRSVEQARELVERVHFSGLTPLGTNFKSKVLDPLVLARAVTNRMPKPVLLIVISDGEPAREPRDTFANAIHHVQGVCEMSKYGSGAFAIEYGLVGTDPDALAYLTSLESDPVIGHLLDCTSNYEEEAQEFEKLGAKLTPELWLLKLCIGAIDSEYDRHNAASE
ncbi:hypothetical protein HK105_209257 [Polyrhizophydium stewartii]|uniref:VWFA domain-containing protein n=1 Tax=Polyrhizophydium stewartii TaxID=2732419 RepID=A0ABR4MVI6_9FUNG